MIAAMLLLLFSLQLGAIDYQGQVTRVIDGDTLIFQTVGQNLRIRLNGIDAPELNQAFGEEAKINLKERALGRFFIARCFDRDFYRRELCFLYDEQQRFLNLELVDEGFAWAYRGRGRLFREAQERARTNRRGLWDDPDPIPPWEWRKKNFLEYPSLVE